MVLLPGPRSAVVPAVGQFQPPMHFRGFSEVLVSPNSSILIEKFQFIH